jgi:putative membrane protein
MMPQQEDDSKTRTNWAEDRTILANERAFSSWMGMGLASVGIAIGFKAVFGAAEPTWPAKLVSFLFLGIAILIYWLARNQEYKTLMRLRERDAEAMPVRNFTQLTSLMSVATVAVGAVLWSL